MDAKLAGILHGAQQDRGELVKQSQAVLVSSVANRSQGLESCFYSEARYPQSASWQCSVCFKDSIFSSPHCIEKALWSS